MNMKYDKVTEIRWSTHSKRTLTTRWFKEVMRMTEGCLAELLSVEPDGFYKVRLSFESECFAFDNATNTHSILYVLPRDIVRFDAQGRELA